MKLRSTNSAILHTVWCQCVHISVYVSEKPFLMFTANYLDNSGFWCKTVWHICDFSLSFPRLPITTDDVLCFSKNLFLAFHWKQFGLVVNGLEIVFWVLMWIKATCFLSVHGACASFLDSDQTALGVWKKNSNTLKCNFAYFSIVVFGRGNVLCKKYLFVYVLVLEKLEFRYYD